MSATDLCLQILAARLGDADANESDRAECREAMRKLLAVVPAPQTGITWPWDSTGPVPWATPMTPVSPWQFPQAHGAGFGVTSIPCSPEITWTPIW